MRPSKSGVTQGVSEQGV